MERVPEDRVAIGFGSNLGDRLANLRLGFDVLRRCLVDAVPSAVYESDPLHVCDQPRFLNACCVGRTRLAPRQLLDEMQRIERLTNRPGDGPRFGPRTLDLDLLLYGERVIGEPDLVVPHPRLREREFVLRPLAELVPEWRVPDPDGSAGGTVAEWLAGLPPQGVFKSRFRLEVP